MILKSNTKISGKNVNCRLDLTAGELSLLYGPNGVGKSSFVHLLKIKQNEIPLLKNSVFIDQFPLQPLNDVSCNDVLKSLKVHRQENNKLFELIEKRLESFINIPIRNLSGGQNQLVKIALGLYLSGELFVFDEPFQFLDKENVNFLKEILLELKKQKKIILLIEHRSELIEELIDSRFELVLHADEIRTVCGN